MRNLRSWVIGPFINYQCKRNFLLWVPVTKFLKRRDAEAPIAPMLKCPLKILGIALQKYIKTTGMCCCHASKFYLQGEK